MKRITFLITFAALIFGLNKTMDYSKDYVYDNLTAQVEESNILMEMPDAKAFSINW